MQMVEKDRGSSPPLFLNDSEYHVRRKKSDSLRGVSISCINYGRICKEQWVCLHNQLEWILQLLIAHKGSLIAFPPKGEKIGIHKL